MFCGFPARGVQEQAPLLAAAAKLLFFGTQQMRLAILICAAAAWAAALPPTGVPLCVLPPTRHLNYSDSCADHQDISSDSISWGAAHIADIHVIYALI